VKKTKWPAGLSKEERESCYLMLLKLGEVFLSQVWGKSKDNTSIVRGKKKRGEKSLPEARLREEEDHLKESRQHTREKGKTSPSFSTGEKKGVVRFSFQKRKEESGVVPNLVC